METRLFQLMMDYIKVHNPELILSATGKFSLTAYINDKVANVSAMMLQLKTEGKPAYIIEEKCMAEATRDLLPSRADYIRSILESDFREEFERFSNGGVLTYEVVNLIEYCAEVFEAYEFSVKNQGSRFLRYAVIAQVADYLIDRS